METPWKTDHQQQVHEWFYDNNNISNDISSDTDSNCSKNNYIKSHVT